MRLPASFAVGSTRTPQSSFLLPTKAVGTQTRAFITPVCPLSVSRTYPSAACSACLTSRSSLAQPTQQLRELAAFPQGRPTLRLGAVCQARPTPQLGSQSASLGARSASLGARSASLQARTWKVLGSSPRGQHRVVCTAVVTSGMAAGNTTSRLVLWFRNDLRLHDNYAVQEAVAAVAAHKFTEVLPVFVFDPRFFAVSPWGNPKTGVYRAQFLLESVLDLKARLRAVGSDLLVTVGRPEVVLPALLQGAHAPLVLTMEETTSEELRVDQQVISAIQPLGGRLQRVWGHTLYHLEDLQAENGALPLSRGGVRHSLPDVFTPFKDKAESRTTIRKELPPPRTGALPLPPATLQCALPPPPPLPLGAAGAATPPAPAAATAPVPAARPAPPGGPASAQLAAAAAATAALRPASRAAPGVPAPAQPMVKPAPAVQPVGMPAPAQPVVNAVPPQAALSASDSTLASLLSWQPTWESLPWPTGVPARPTVHPNAVLDFKGGETAALARLQYYLWDKDLLATYFDTRNGMLGGDYSTKFAPWLAHGCLSPRTVYHAIKKYEKERVANKSTYWVIFELIWRDFYKLFSLKHGPRIFHETGPSGTRRTWVADPEVWARWRDGRTGLPLVDANMRELAATGFMSNRGRQNVASHLVLELGVDWRRGADLFESLLLDYDVSSNWGNWAAAAGLTGGRVNLFNITKQSKDYDLQGDYIRTWIPELKNVPATHIHEPWLLTKEEQARFGVQIGLDYPAPVQSTKYARPQSAPYQPRPYSAGPGPGAGRGGGTAGGGRGGGVAGGGGAGQGRQEEGGSRGRGTASQSSRGLGEVPSLSGIVKLKQDIRK